MSLSYKNPSSFFKNLSKERLVDMFCFFEFQVSITHELAVYCSRQH